jgi:hypothetical protein
MRSKDDVRHERPIHLWENVERLLKHRARTYSPDSGEERHFVSVEVMKRVYVDI